MGEERDVMSRGRWEVPGHHVTENAGDQMCGWGHFEGKTKQWFRTALCPNAWHLQRNGGGLSSSPPVVD